VIVVKEHVVCVGGGMNTLILLTEEHTTSDYWSWDCTHYRL